MAVATIRVFELANGDRVAKQMTPEEAAAFLASNSGSKLIR